MRLEICGENFPDKENSKGGGPEWTCKGAGGWSSIVSGWEKLRLGASPALRVPATLSTALRVALTGTAERTSEGVEKKGEDDNRTSE